MIVLLSIDLKYSRPPTELLPNSPDSTPAPSRQGYDIASRNSNRSSQHAQATEDADNFIKVVIREHGGHSAEKPFTIHPKQMVCLSNLCYYNRNKILKPQRLNFISLCR